MRPTECPSADRLQAFLAAESGDASGVDIETHVESCPHCQNELDRLSDPESLRPFREAATRVDAPPRLPVPYRILGRLGRGSMGAVWLARDEDLQRDVAIKALHSADPDAATRFVREARAAAGIRNPHVIPIHAVLAPADSPPLIVMELVDGPTLREAAAASRGVEPRQAAGWLAQAADGLTAAHAAGLVHRDVKPANVLIGSDGIARVADFGLARVLDERSPLTRSGLIVGTPAYMCPEQVRDPSKADARSDVYGLGATLYEALTGVEPFRGSVQLVIGRVLAEEPIPPRRINPSIPRDLETIALKAMAKEPARRYASAAEFQADLRRWLNGEPIHARPAGRIERAWRWSRRHPLPASLAATLALVITASIVALAILWQQAVKSAADATQARSQSEKDLERAEGVVGRFYGKLYEEGTLAAPVSLDTRRELIQDAIRFYKDVAIRRPGQASDLDVGTAYSRLGWLNNQLRDAEGAREAYRRAIAKLESVEGEPRRDRTLAECHFYSGITAMRLGDAADASRCFAESARRFEALGADEKSRYFLAGSLGNGGVVHEFLGETDSARVTHARARAIYADLRKLHPKDAGYLQDLFWETLALGILDPDAAKAVVQLEEADKLAAEYAAAYRTDFNSVKVRCAAKTELALALLRAGRTADAATAAGAAVASAGTMVKFPAPFNAPGTQAWAWSALADVKWKQNEHAEAAKAWSTAAALYEPLPRKSLAEQLYARRQAVVKDRLLHFGRPK